ncbi:helix-turn-helix domain-containing protein [Streptomyces sp. NBC_01808]|uniref:PucR family transcriptional regulator n=1 Tax=Streptomyces sp. NBC_01808 TaxID=2975947 RepID=UPI002DD9E676|nr:helix-turn-helix domain-containing protein [Streptomyces sp. NBC_01808]WSA38684.1 helix-turn-helix domain-containing protein [Streptomyces sp. NBC_01808]
MAHDTSHKLHMTVESLLAEPVLRGRLLGGKAGLRREVTWCLPLAELPPPPGADRPAAGEDLAGIAVYAPAAELVAAPDSRRLLSGLAARGAAAVLARLQQGVEPDLGPLMRAADTAGLPLVRLAPEADYHRVGRLVAVKSIADTAHVLEYSVRVHRTLGEVFASGSGLPALARSMATLSGGSVLILDRGGELLARAERDRAASDAEWQELADAVHAKAGGARPQSLHAGHHHVAARDLDVAAPWGERLHVVCAPVGVAGEPYGTVAVVEPVLAPESHALAQHRVIVEQGAPLVASEILRQRSVTEAEERSRDDFLDTLVHGRFTDAHELEARSRHYRFDMDARHAVFVVAMPAASAARAQAVQRAVAGAADAAGGGPGGTDRPAAGAAPGHGKGFTMATLMGRLLVVVAEFAAADAAAPFDAQAEKTALQRYGRWLHRLVTGRADPGAQIAYGRAATGAAGVAASFREARITLELSGRVQVPEVCGYAELRVFAAVEEAAASAQGREFAREVLEPLRRADGQTGNLEQVVLAYIAESGNLNAAARRLQLHRNTMLYKLERASRALQMDVRSAETQFTVWLAHRIQTLNDSLRVLQAELSPPA